jgi:hypothetical protein
MENALKDPYLQVISTFQVSHLNLRVEAEQNLDHGFRTHSLSLEKVQG